MKTLSIKKDYKEINISNPSYVARVIERLKLENIEDECEITLDLSGCITDYPDTPLLIDFFWNLLSKKQGNKRFIIIYTGIGTNELHVLYDIVLDGLFFGIKKESKGKNNLNEWIKIIEDKLVHYNISLTIECPYDDLNYNYGK